MSNPIALMRSAYLSVDAAVVRLHSRGVIRVHGADTVKFLQVNTACAQHVR
jgi:folate-binding Fe-S cluster repair protein YgfZ